MTSVFQGVDTIAGEPQVDGGNCVSLVKHYAPGLIGLPTSAWREGAKVIDTRGMPRGTAVATFESGRYPRRDRDNHAGFFLAHAHGGFWIMDQYAHGTRKEPVIAARLLRRLGKNPNGTYKDPSNNAEAFSAIER